MRSIVVLLALLPTQLFTQTGLIRGTVTAESSGKPIDNATITLSHSSYVAHTDAKGAYRLSTITPGIYDLTIAAPGYVRLVYKEMTVPPAVPMVLAVKMRSDGGKPGQSIAIKVSSLPDLPKISEDKMLFYEPDSTLHFKLRIVNPEKSHDSSAARRK